MKEEFLNTVVRKYNKHLKAFDSNSNKITQLQLNFNDIIIFLNENRKYSFKKELLTKESLDFVKERNIDILIKRSDFKETLRSRIHNFTNSSNLSHIQTFILKNYTKKQDVELKDIVILIEKEILKIIDANYEDLQKLTKSNLLYAKKKRQIFLNLVNYFNLNNNQIIKLINEENIDYQNLKELFELLETELQGVEIKPYYFLRSIMHSKDTRRKMALCILP
jgi:hypothetical protein